MQGMRNVALGGWRLLPQVRREVPHPEGKSDLEGRCVMAHWQQVGMSIFVDAILVVVIPVIVWQGIKMVKELLPDIKEEMKRW